ncbi:MAG: hypothetical protein RLY58_1849, partial [Pseudomonadota bacterium]
RDGLYQNKLQPADLQRQKEILGDDLYTTNDGGIALMMTGVDLKTKSSRAEVGSTGHLYAKTGVKLEIAVLTRALDRFKKSLAFRTYDNVIITFKNGRYHLELIDVKDFVSHFMSNSAKYPHGTPQFFEQPKFEDIIRELYNDASATLTKPKVDGLADEVDLSVTYKFNDRTKSQDPRTGQQINDKNYTGPRVSDTAANFEKWFLDPIRRGDQQFIDDIKKYSKVENQFNDAGDLITVEQQIAFIQRALLEGRIKSVGFEASDFNKYQKVVQQGSDDHVSLDMDNITATLPAARQYWLDAGASAQVLDQIQFHISDLGERVAAITQGAQVTLDRTGAGWGWFIDSTPQEHSEFVQSATLGMDASADSPAHGKLDLLTVLIHEMGHVLGVDPKMPDDVMTQVLDTGERRLPSTLDAMLLQYNASNRVAQTGQHVLQAKAWSPVASQATLNNAAWLDNGTDWLTQGEIIYSGNRATLKETRQTHTRLAQAFQVNTGDRGLQFTLDHSTLSRLTGQPNDALEVALLNANTSKAIC